MRALMISNPIASAFTHARRRVIERALEATFALDVATTTHRGHAAELACEAATLGAKVIVAFGGDGTVNEVVNGLIGTADSTDVTLAVLPGGGTNVLCRALGTPRDPVDATGTLIDLVEAGSVRRIGLGCVHMSGGDAAGTRLFTQSCGLGFDAETVRRVEASGLRPRWGDLAFVYAAFGAFRAVRRAGGPHLHLDHAAGTAQAWWVTVTNADPMTYWGPRGLRATPDARYELGLDVLAAKTMRTPTTLRWVTQALTTRGHVGHKHIEYVHDAHSLTVRADAPTGLHTDGEYLGSIQEAQLRYLPEALPVYAVL